MPKANATPTNPDVDAYIDSFAPQVQTALKKMRQWIRKLAPTAQEVFSYRIACYKHHGLLVGFGATVNHCSFYLCDATTLASFKKEVQGFNCEKGTIHFAPEKPLPFALIKKLVQHRMKENEARTAKKKRIK